MIRLKLDEMLEKRGLTAYGLHIKSLEKDEKGEPILDDKGNRKYRLHQSVISKIKNNKSKALQLDILDVICELLHCQPADLIVYEVVFPPIIIPESGIPISASAATKSDKPKTKKKA